MPSELIVADFLRVCLSAIPRALLEGHYCIHEGQKENAFSEAQKRAEVLRHPCILGGPQRKRDKIRSGYLVLAFSKAEKRVEMLGEDCESLTPTQGATQQSMDFESLTPT